MNIDSWNLYHKQHETENRLSTGLVDVSLIFKSGLLEYSKWPENLTDVHKRIFAQHEQ
jgi:hypothetical protein